MKLRALALGLAVIVSSAQTTRQRVPFFEPDPLWSETLPNKWVTGQVGGVAVDSHDNVWVFHRPATIPDGEKAAALNPPQAECCIPAPPVLQFTPNGTFVRAWGGPGQGYEWFTSEHGIFVDAQDNVWLSGNAREDNQILKFTPEGKYKRHWGAYGKPPDDSYKFPARAELVKAPPAPQFHNPVHSVVVSNDDLVYVADRTNNRFQVFRLDGTFVKEVFIARNTLQAEGTVHHFAFSPDKAQQFLYLVDGSNKAVRVLNRQTLEIVANVGGHAGHNAREFFHIHSVAVDSKGTLYLGEVNNGQRYYRYAYRGVR
jgi:hypothetical protein